MIIYIFHKNIGVQSQIFFIGFWHVSEANSAWKQYATLLSDLFYVIATGRKDLQNSKSLQIHENSALCNWTALLNPTENSHFRLLLFSSWLW